MGYVKVEDVAAVCDVSEKTVRRWCRKGVLPAIKPMGVWLIAENWPDVLKSNHGSSERSVHGRALA